MLDATHPAADLDHLRAALPGRVAAPGDDGYDDARRPWNLAVDQRPAVVADARSAEDVRAAVRFAADAGLRVAVQATGHRASALPPLHDALLLRVGALRGVQVDPGARRARVAAGTPAADLVAAAAEHGLHPVVGSSKTVSAAGFTLGGGIGFTGRRLGVAANHVLAVEVVTADGELRRVDRATEPDLLWALRGTGGALGVVVAFDVALHPIAEVHAGMSVWDAAHAPALLRAWTAWAADAPDGITTSLRLMHVPPLPMFPEPLRGRSVVMVQGASLDGAADADELLGRLRAVAAPDLEQWATMPAAALQDVHGDPVDPMPSAGAAVPLGELPEAAIDALVAAAGPASGVMAFDLRQLGGAFAAGAPDGGATDRVEAAFMGMLLALVPDPAAVADVHAALAQVADAMAPWRAARSVTTFEEQRGTAGDLHAPAVADRLRAIARAYDPQGLFVVSHPLA